MTLTFTYVLLGLYAAAIYALSWRGLKQTKTAEGFAIGNRDMSPVLIGLTLAASISSTATFVINPGFVYTHGVSAYLHFGVAGALGIAVGLIVLTRRFYVVGSSQGSLTIPEWIQQRYQSRSLGLFFAVINLLSITFVVLILVGCSLLLSSLLQIDQKLALILILFFVFSYVLMGGTYAHAYTNALQGVMMLFVAAALFIDGWHYFGGAPLAALASVSENYAATYNPNSSLYFDFFSVFLSGFVVTFALMLQPHILTKVLYLQSERDTRTFLLTTIGTGTVFMLVLFIGFYARLAGYEIEQQDAVVREYLVFEFAQSAWGPYILVIIFVALLAAGMSTLDGILVALSAMVTTDILKPLGVGEERGLLVARLVLIAIGIIALIVAWDPPALVGLFAQKGVYGLAAATLVPVLFGVMSEEPISVWVVGPAAVIGLATHLVLNLGLGVENPAISATYGIFFALAWGMAALIFQRLMKN